MNLKARVISESLGKSGERYIEIQFKVVGSKLQALNTLKFMKPKSEDFNIGDELIVVIGKDE